MKINNTKEFSGILMVLGSAILYSSKSIIVKYALANQVLAQDLIFWRILLALPLFWGAWLLIEDNHDFRLTKTELITVLYMGAFGVALPVLCSYSSLKYISASVSILVIFTYPAIVTVLSLVFLKEKIGIQKGGSVVITYLGLIMVLELVNGPRGSIDYRGVLLAGLAALSFATHQILAQRILVKVSQFKLSAYTSTVAVNHR